MDSTWLNLLSQIFEVCIVPLLGILTTFLVSFIKTKKEELLSKISVDKTEEEKQTLEKYLNLVETTVVDCVQATNQTYVETLKAEGSFDAEAQKIAFNKTLESVLGILSDDAKEYLTEIFGDLNTYLTNLIESKVNTSKITKKCP